MNSTAAIEYLLPPIESAEVSFMLARLVAVDEGPDIMLDRALVVVGRHPACDTRLDSLRVSRQHCCMVQENGEVVVRDLGSTNGIRINGQRVEIGRLKVGDELSIAHIRFRLENGKMHEHTIAESSDLPPSNGAVSQSAIAIGVKPEEKSALVAGSSSGSSNMGETAFAAAVRKLLPSALADKCRIQVIVQMTGDGANEKSEPAPVGQPSASENGDACRSDSSH
jgi:pSer/pThr/pTyr-binding forkhead associated (FHA) protein